MQVVNAETVDNVSAPEIQVTQSKTADVPDALSAMHARLGLPSKRTSIML